MENADNNNDWRVANYQIPVPIGDCSAHFLIKMKDKKVEKIEKAFLMDGGTNAGGYFAWVQILKGLRHIDLELGTDWKFDNWVVTHWDEDHYRGVRDLLSSNLKLFRFVQKGEKVPTTRSSSSTFVQQYFCKEPWLLCGAINHVMFFNKKEEHDVGFLQPFMDIPQLYYSETIEKTFRENTRLNTESSWLIIKSARLRCLATEMLVGIDLFTRTRQFNFDGTICSGDPKSVGRWGIYHDKKSTQPRFCVIGADGYGIGTGKDDRIVSKPSRNETSILAILYWSNGRCSYYTGGDGSPEVAKQVFTKWLSKSSFFLRQGQVQVDLMKLDHHGSTKENLGSKKNPDTGTNSIVAEESEGAKRKASDIITDILMKTLKPQGLLVTPGTQHGHPTWDVLLAIYNYFGSLKDADGLFTTRSFYWLDANKAPSIKNLNFNHNETEYMQAVYDTVYDSYHGETKPKDIDGKEPEVIEIEASEDDDGETPQKELENLEGVYKRIQEMYRDGGKIEEEDEEATFYELFVLDQKVRVEIQAEFGEQKRRYGFRLKKKGRKDILKKGKIDWGMVQESLTKTCQELLKLKPEELDRQLHQTLKASSHGVDSCIFWAWHSWVWHVEDSLLDGAVQYSDVCWQPIISEGNPHFIISFVFENHGEDRFVEIFNDDGEYQLINDTERVSRVPTNLFVQNKDERWTELVYTPLTLATIFDLSGLDTRVVFKNDPMIKQALVGNMNQMKLAIEVLSNTMPVNPNQVVSKQSTASTRRLIKSAKLRMEKLYETIGRYKEMDLVDDFGINEEVKKDEWIATNRTPRTKSPNTVVALDKTSKTELISKIRTTLLKLAHHSYVDLTEALLHDQICHFAWHYMSDVTNMGKIILLVWSENYDGGVKYDEMQEDAMLRSVDFLLSNFKLEETLASLKLRE